ncbi:hypothetical protein SGFS_012520 [Streptomyces graminofaciens]|uniref:Uncharacterized protein n=1 Tax=Streptomyces graminofaciens TaxID=68212 RepID=A0ABN5VAN6_9ACTN|nr:hypothetical protein SGFS_012520 [Streptomyces graminofaciens]
MALTEDRRTDLEGLAHHRFRRASAALDEWADLLDGDTADGRGRAHGLTSATFEIGAAPNGFLQKNEWVHPEGRSLPEATAVFPEGPLYFPAGTHPARYLPPANRDSGGGRRLTRRSCRP